MLQAKVKKNYIQDTPIYINIRDLQCHIMNCKRHQSETTITIQGAGWDGGSKIFVFNSP